MEHLPGSTQHSALSIQLFAEEPKSRRAVMTIKKYKSPREKRRVRVRVKVKGTKERPRLSVFRSRKRIYAQLIDDEKGETLVAAMGGSDVNAAGEVGKILAEKALKLKIKQAVFDRGGYKYHGRVKALAEGAREGGLEF